MEFSKKIESVSPSPTLAISAKARSLKSRGIDVVSFGAGEPDFDTPQPIREAAKTALDDGFTRYTEVGGLPELREAIGRYILSNNGTEYLTDEIITTCGAKSAIFIALEVLLNTGDEVIIPSPYWVSYPEQVKLAGATPVIVETKEANRFKLTPEALAKAITDRTKIFVINSPCNPTGSVYTKEELHNLMDICISKGLLVISDEIYDKLVYDTAYCSTVSSHPRAKEFTIYINGVSKTFAMTGWRLGFAAAPLNIIKAMRKYQGQLLTNVTSFVQKAAITAFDNYEGLTGKMVSEFKKRRDIIMNLILEIPDVSCITPQGTFYAFPNIGNYLGRNYDGSVIDTSCKLADYLLEEAHVAVVPGEAFGMDGYIRLSFATSEEEINKGLERIGEALSKLI